MREPERDISRLEDILYAIDCVEEYTKGVSESQLKADKLRLHATIYNVQIIGEAIYKLTKEFKEGHHETPWHLVRMQESCLAVHGWAQWLASPRRMCHQSVRHSVAKL